MYLAYEVLPTGGRLEHVPWCDLGAEVTAKLHRVSDPRSHALFFCRLRKMSIIESTASSNSVSSP